MIDRLGAVPLMTGAVFAGFCLDWLAVRFNWQTLKPFSKPLAMALVILFTLAAARWQINVLVAILLCAQICGLAGDVFLMYPTKGFVWGLFSFLIGHLLYITILACSFYDVSLSRQVCENQFMWIGLCLVLWAALMRIFYHLVSPAFKVRKITRTLWIALQAYAWILSGMMTLTLLAVLVLPGYSGKYLLLLLGSSLFLISDSLLAFDRFIRKLIHGRLWVRITYHLAQFSLAWGFLAMLAQ